jgi:hypothetical protein
VRVATRALEHLPSLSWQEQLPPLHGPLTAVLAPARDLPALEQGEAAQQ